MDRITQSTISSNVNDISNSTKYKLVLLLIAVVIFIAGIITGILIISTTKNSELNSNSNSINSSKGY